MADLLARRKETQKMIALRLSLLGWTQEEIADKAGISRVNYSRDFLPQFSDLKKDAKKTPPRTPGVTPISQSTRKRATMAL